MTTNVIVTKNGVVISSNLDYLDFFTLTKDEGIQLRFEDDYVILKDTRFDEADERHVRR